MNLHTRKFHLFLGFRIKYTIQSFIGFNHDIHKSKLFFNDIKPE